MNRHSDEQMKELLQKRDSDKIKFFKEYARLVSEIPEDLAKKENMTEEKMKEVFAPIADKLFVFMKENNFGADVLDFRMVQQLCEMHTLQRISNVLEELMRGSLFAKLGYEYPAKDMPISQIEELGKIVVDK